MILLNLLYGLLILLVLDDLLISQVLESLPEVFDVELLLLLGLFKLITVSFTILL